MSLWSRLANVFRNDRLTREIDEELHSHLEEAVSRGRDPIEARKSFGFLLHEREASRDVRLVAWLDSLRADAVFGWRQLIKRKVTSAAAILSLALAIGSCTSAFRLIDALLLRPLPVAHAGRLYVLTRHGASLSGKPTSFDGWAYPAFQLMRDAVQGRATLLAASYAEPADLTYGSLQEMEKAETQFVSGSTFTVFGLRPSIGRVFTQNDDLKPGAHPYAVLSYDYWTRRFARDPQVVGRTFRMGDTLYQIVGVGPESFTGTETGAVIDVFLPAMMNPAVTRDDATWHRTLAVLQPGEDLEPIRASLNVTARAFEAQRAKGFSNMTPAALRNFLDQTLVMEPAASGASGLQQDYRVSLIAIAALVGLVLLIACANVANLMTAQAEARAREMAMRVSIGAGRARLVQLVLVESAWLALLSASLGALFAWWSAPFVVSRINPPDNPVRLFLPADWCVFAFGAAITILVTLLFGLAPALRASAVNPARALKGGSDPHARRRLMHTLIAAQAAFCFLVLFMAGLFAATFDRLSHRPTGFSADRVLALDTVAQRAQSPIVWDQVADRLRQVPGVESVGQADWPLLTGNSWNGFVSVNGAPPGPVLAYFLHVSPGWVDTMKIPLVEGRDFRPNEAFPGAGIVNEEFARQFSPGASPVGRIFAKGTGTFQVVGVIRDAPYKNMHDPILPVAFVPTHSTSAGGALQPIRTGTFVVRTSAADPLSMASALRRALAGVRSDFRVRNVSSMAGLVRAQTVRERLLAMLSLFFAAVALLLAGIGLYGVLDYSVLQRRREIGIRMAIGARAGDIARGITLEALFVVIAGAAAGLVLATVSVKYVASLLYQVQPIGLLTLASPAGVILGAALLASLPAVIRAVRIDPVTTLRSE